METQDKIAFSSKNVTFSKIVALYLFLCITGILISLPLFNRLIRQHDLDMTSNVCNLIAEKMNNSIAYMTRSVKDSAVLLGTHDMTDMEAAYEEITEGIEDAEYSSIGLIDNNGRIYGSEPEKKEIEKWGLLELAKLKSGVAISEPYRSSMNGKMAITMFSPIYKGNVRYGTLFVTYPLEEIQNMANTNVLKEETEIYLMNPYSDNFIWCSGTDNALIGSWNNMMLHKRNIKDIGENSYSEWEQKMKENEKRGSVNFEIDGVVYTQVFESIDAMEDWSVVVRIPSSALSNTLRIFQGSSIATVGILVLASLVLFSFSHKKEMQERWLLEYASIHDALTNVMNRRAFEFMVKSFLEENHKKHNEKKANGALLFLDIDFFKQVNDRFGHDTGDMALCAFADGLKKVFAENCIVARYGGDEFIVLVKHMDSEEWLNTRLEEFKRELLQFDPDVPDAEDFELHYSAGIAKFPENSMKMEDLMQCADVALYQVKKRGRNGYAWYSHLEKKD